MMPCIDSYQKVDLRTVSFDVPPQEVRIRIMQKKEDLDAGELLSRIMEKRMKLNECEE